MLYCFMRLLFAEIDAPTKPSSAAVPVTLANVDVAEVTCTRYSAPDWNARFPATVMDEPGVPLPGMKMPPPAMVALPVMPAPVSVPPEFTVVRLEDAIEPST